MTANESSCSHPALTILNPWEYVRKYRCRACHEVMMCACDEDVATRFLPHQLTSTTEYETGDVTAVTSGFRPRVCDACRGLPPVANPVAEIHGRTSKFKRYYWRELYFEPRRRFIGWASARNLGSQWSHLIRKYHEDFEAIQVAVEAELKALHAQQPKYHYEREQSQAEVIAEFQVELVEIGATIVGGKEGARVRVLAGAEQASPEEFAERHFRALGYHVLHTESVPFHALFSVLLWPLVQDRADKQVREVFFGDRQAFEDRGPGPPPLVTALLPSDFGKPSYAHRRAIPIEQYLSTIPNLTDMVLGQFDRLLPGSFSLRQYLWAHRERDAGRARTLIEVLGADTVKRILKYLVECYWARYLGWPDMIVHRASDFAFVEVKASRDKLREDQKRWIRDNANVLRLPFKILKIHATDRL